MQKFMNWGLAGLFALLGGAASAQVAVYDTSTNLLTIPSVKVGASTYTNVILKNSFLFTLQDATEQTPAGQGYASYDGATNMLTIPAVKVGAETYLDVKLLNTGNFVFMLQSTTQLTASTVGEVNTFFASYDALFAMSLPASGATMFSLDDACYRNDGRTKAYNIADYDPNSALTNLLYAPRIGQRRANLQVLAVRNSVNSNGSSRREIDVQYDAVFTDGSTKKAETETLISGSSQGTSGCSSPQTGSSLRRLGDQRWVGFALQARMTREERYSIVTGEALTPSVRYRRDMRFLVTDPVGNATYVVVSGPGPTSYDAKSAGWSWKMVSPRVMRSAPELAGKTGNFTNALGAGGGSTVSYQTLGFTGGEKSNGTPIVVGDISIAIPSGTSNSNVAEAVMVGLRGSPSFTDHAIERRENTLLVIFPPTVTDASALSFSAGRNTGINMSVNAPSGVINGINHGTNPWLSFINNSSLSSFQILGFTGEDNEKPQHRVNIQSFAIGKYEVTQEQWYAVMGNNPSSNKGRTLPVESVSWNDTQLFVQKLSQKTGFNYRLPSEAEWEYAARAGSTTSFFWGEDAKQSSNYSWHHVNSAGESQHVGLKKPNQFGLYDMIGNVLEWTQDCWHENYIGAPTNGSAWMIVECSTWVLRGGSHWQSRSQELRSAYRATFRREKSFPSAGFRVARDL